MTSDKQITHSNIHVTFFMKKDMQKAKDEFLTLKQAAKFIGKSVHNVSYLITYGKISKYNSAGKVVKKGTKGLVFVSKNELDQYTKSWQKNYFLNLQCFLITVSIVSVWSLLDCEHY